MTVADRIDISVIIATNNRAASLQRTIASIQSQNLSGLTCELIVAENGGTAQSSALGEWPPLNLVYMWEPAAGKSRALNRALEIARGELIVFTDDDVIVSSRWLPELFRAAQSYPEEVAFCGPIVPAYPSSISEWLPSHPYATMLFASFEITLREGPLPSPLMPLGPNLAIRASVAKNMRFRLDLGPSQEQGWFMGEDTAFAAELRDRYSILTSSEGFIFVPAAAVTHVIDEHKTEFPWMMERFFNLGRSRIVRFGRITHICKRPRLLTGELPSDAQARLVCGAELNFYYGQFHQCCVLKDDSRRIYLQQLLDRLHYREHYDLLCPSVRNLHTREHPPSADAVAPA